jgi:hypothetical protein
MIRSIVYGLALATIVLLLGSMTLCSLIPHEHGAFELHTPAR